MTIYSCEQELVAMFTCIYVGWASNKGYKNIRFMLEPIEQYTLFDEYVHVEPDEQKAESVKDAICRKISPFVYSELAYCSMSCEADVLDNIYRVLLLGFNHGPDVLQMTQYSDIMRNREITKRLSNEVCRFREIVRFHEIGRSLYIAHIEPKSKLLLSLGHAFSDRMPSENWMIVDDVHKEAIIKPADEPYYYRKLNDDEMSRLMLTEQENDEYTDLWKVFFDSIAIKERENYRCQRNLFPIWARKHAVEFSDS